MLNEDLMEAANARLTLDGEPVGTLVEDAHARMVHEIGLLRSKQADVATGTFQIPQLGSNIKECLEKYMHLGEQLPNCTIEERVYRNARHYRSKKKRLQKKWRTRNLLKVITYHGVTIKSIQGSEASMECHRTTHK